MNKLAVIILSFSTFLLLSACQTSPSGQTTYGSPYGSPYGSASSSYSSKGAKIEQASRGALQELYAQNEAARRLGQSAEAILVFPGIYKGGFLFGGEGGNGTLFFGDGSVGGFYNTAGASYGLQAGLQKYSYALFMMDQQAIQQLNKAGGWNIGSSPSLVVADDGIAASLSATTVTRGVYAFFFNHSGLMAGLSLQGSKITRIYP